MKQETLEDFTKEVLQDEFFTNIAEYGKAERLIEIGAKWQQEKSYSEEDIKSAWEDGRNGETECIGSYPFYKTVFKNKTFKEWFNKFKKK
jgi:hypothetical protein